MQLSPQAFPSMQILQQPEGAACVELVSVVLELPAAEVPDSELEPPPAPDVNVSSPS
jgi:hypothetical protein